MSVVCVSNIHFLLYWQKINFYFIIYNPLTPFKPIILHNPGQYDYQADVSCKWSPKDF